jgi:hypothetical protein
MARWCPKVLFHVAEASCFSECAITSAPSRSTITSPSWVGCSVAGQGPDMLTDLEAGPADRGLRPPPARSEGIDEPGDTAVNPNWP